MACVRSLCTADRAFTLINIAFAMYAGALLATAARLAWDPSTYAWFRYLCQAQYTVSAAYVLGAGLWLAALAALGAAGARRCGSVYIVGVSALAVSELAYGAWMAASLERWWRVAPQAELARRGMDLVHDLKPALLAVERYRDLARPVYDMIEEVEREAPNNAFVIVAFGLVGAVLQVAALVLARRLAVKGDDAATASLTGEVTAKQCQHCHDADSDRDDEPKPRQWRKDANLRMYTILDKIF